MADGQILWEDAAPKRGLTTIQGPTTQAVLGTLATTLASYSNAVWIENRFPTKNGSPGTAATDAYRGCAMKAILYFRNSATDKRVTLSIPAPKDSLFDYLAGKNPSVKTADGATIATALSTCTGLTFTFEKGIFRNTTTGSKKV